MPLTPITQLMGHTGRCDLEGQDRDLERSERSPAGSQRSPDSGNSSERSLSPVSPRGSRGSMGHGVFRPWQDLDGDDKSGRKSGEYFFFFLVFTFNFFVRKSYFSPKNSNCEVQ